MADKNPIKLCECGCGQKTSMARQTRSDLGHIRGQPIRFINGHNKPNLRHGQCVSREYRCWSHMLERCNNQHTENWNNYGGRGITVCERWLIFENFFADMGECPEGFSIERLNNDGSYGPGNCVWADTATQSRNKRSNVRLTHDGKTMSLADWSRALKLNTGTIVARRKRGWPTNKILSPCLFDTRGRPKS